MAAVTYGKGKALVINIPIAIGVIPFLDSDSEALFDNMELVLL
jgi:hypothetical protein